MTFLNCLKPLHVDDTYYWHYATQIAAHPLDPYGFELFWDQSPVPANHSLAPPVIPYWLSVVMRFLGGGPAGWKVSLLAFHLLLVVALGGVFRRFCRPLEHPLVAMTVLSPAVLPGLNLMLDIPALAVGLGGLCLFFRAVDWNSGSVATAAGFVIGLAMETKYTTFVVPAVCLLYGAITGRRRLAVVTGATAVVLFGAWETFVVWRYGESNFLWNVRSQGESLWTKCSHLAMPLLTLMGGVAPATMVLGLVALGRRKWAVMAATAGLGLLTALALVPEEAAVLWRNSVTGKPRLTVNNLVFGGLGVALAGTVLAVVVRLLQRRPTWTCRPGLFRQHRVEWFLVGWLLLEVAGYFTISPFPAVRRVIGVVVVATVVVGRLAAQTGWGDRRAAWVWPVAAGSAMLGLAVYTVDLREALAERRAIAKVARRLGDAGTGRAWFAGHWGIQYYAERAGMRPVIPGRSRLAAGDWLAVPDDRVAQQPLSLDMSRLEEAGRVTVTDRLPLQTLSCYYGGRTALEHHEGPRVRLTLYRVCREWTPGAAPP